MPYHATSYPATIYRATPYHARLRLQALQFREPKRARSVGRHAQVAARRQRNRTNLWSVGHRRALKLLREEAAIEHL